MPLSTHSSKCPWRVKVDPLQTLQFTLFSFGHRRIPSDCPWSVVFSEGGKVATEHPLCHLSSRETAAYTSKSNLVTVRVSYKENIVLPVPYFLKYEGTFSDFVDIRDRDQRRQIVRPFAQNCDLITYPQFSVFVIFHD